MSTSNANRFRKVVSTVLGVPPDDVHDGLTPDRVDTWDSLNHINLIGALEQEFGVQFDTQDLGNALSVLKLKSLLVEHGVAI